MFRPKLWAALQVKNIDLKEQRQGLDFSNRKGQL